MPATPRTLDFEDLYERARQNGAEIIQTALETMTPADIRPRVLEVTHDVTGPKGGTSSQVLFTMEIDGQIMPVLCSIYANRQIDNKILAVARERERLAQRDTALREALGLTATVRQPELAGMPASPQGHIAEDVLGGPDDPLDHGSMDSWNGEDGLDGQ